jgi:AcrR family transcriptional regulator
MGDTRARILAEATRQLTRIGYGAFTVASVRDALGLSSGSMFHAFASKPALAAAVYVEGMASYQRAALDAIAGAADPQAALRAWIAAHLLWIEENKDLARYLFSTLPDEVTAEAEQPLRAHNDAFFGATASLFDRAAAAGLMARLPREVAHVICIGPAHEYGRRWAGGAVATSPRKLVGVLQEAALAALAATSSTTSSRATKTARVTNRGRSGTSRAARRPRKENRT